MKIDKRTILEILGICLIIYLILHILIFGISKYKNYIEICTEADLNVMIAADKIATDISAINKSVVPAAIEDAMLKVFENISSTPELLNHHIAPVEIPTYKIMRVKLKTGEIIPIGYMDENDRFQTLIK